ncbi:MAG TPA: hypothetical protein PK468_26250, partial [Candidatus Hydrogenedentes bacterium]|nr:hypothetical protein [Candidatus Hydrogenedentota bacterium]
ARRKVNDMQCPNCEAELSMWMRIRIAVADAGTCKHCSKRLFVDYVASYRPTRRASYVILLLVAVVFISALLPDIWQTLAFLAAMAALVGGCARHLAVRFSTPPTMTRDSHAHRYMTLQHLGASFGVLTFAGMLTSRTMPSPFGPIILIVAFVSAILGMIFLAADRWV